MWRCFQKGKSGYITAKLYCIGGRVFGEKGRKVLGYKINEELQYISDCFALSPKCTFTVWKKVWYLISKGCGVLLIFKHSWKKHFSQVPIVVQINIFWTEQMCVHLIKKASIFHYSIFRNHRISTSTYFCIPGEGDWLDTCSSKPK